MTEYEADSNNSNKLDITTSSATTAVGSNKSLKNNNNSRRSMKRYSILNLCDGNSEVKAWVWDSVIQGVFFMSLAFYASAIVGLAEKKAGCDRESEEEVCEGKVYGVRPGAILTLITSIAGFLGSILMPLVGAIVDHTDYRRGIALWSAVAMLVMAGLQMLLSEETLLMCIIFMALGPIAMLVHIVTMFAYLNELTEDERKLGQYMGLFVGIRSIAMLLFMLIVIAISTSLIKVDTADSLQRDIATARISQGLIVLVAGFSFIPTFHHGIGPRAALSKCPPGSSLIGAGFRKLVRTTRGIVKTCPAIKWYLLANILFGSVVTSIPSITISYMTDFLRMDASQTGIAMLIVSFFMIVGSLAYRSFNGRICAALSLKASLLVLTILFILCATILEGPQHKNRIYYLCPFWALCFGWIIPNGRTIYITISPKGQEAELMGIYIFFCNGFIWLPPLIVTILITNAVSWRIAIAMLGIFVLLSIFTLIFMGSYDAAKLRAIQLTTDTLHFDDDSATSITNNVVKGQQQPVVTAAATESMEGSDNAIMEEGNNNA